MAIKHKTTQPTNNADGHLFPAFPDTDIWAMKWDGEALGQSPTGMHLAASKPKSGGNSWEKR
ncbi:MAG TPA: hypothetical protein VHP83_12080 [Aggregatilineaceae bacterium]|nr:hypothetical protein [Aggregatilineaceae bacterium]